MKRARQREIGITLALFSDASIAPPPRPARPQTPEHVPTAAPQDADMQESSFAPPHRGAATGTLGNAWPEPLSAPDVPRSEPPRLRLETHTDRPGSHGADPRIRRAPRPMDGTLQFLPGRFEVLAGREVGQEIRFVRQPGSPQTEITFGRQDGVAYRHVQLQEPTVSRLHAKVTLEGNDWRLTNLSSTNPANVNGTSLSVNNGSIVLRDGDRVEMGEAVFRFRAK
jgi:predicted component of type VI protein secretion system